MNVTAEQVMQMGTGAATNPANKATGEIALGQAVITLTDVLKLLVLVMIEIRDKK